MRRLLGFSERLISRERERMGGSWPSSAALYRGQRNTGSRNNDKYRGPAWRRHILMKKNA